MTSTGNRLRQYRVSMRSRPGFYAQYDGDVTVYAENESDAINQAFRELKRTAFPDRSCSMWKVDGVECVG